MGFLKEAASVLGRDVDVAAAMAAVGVPDGESVAAAGANTGLGAEGAGAGLEAADAAIALSSGEAWCAAFFLPLWAATAMAGNRNVAKAMDLTTR